MWSWTVTIVIRPSIGIVPEWLETTRAPPSAGMFSMPRTSMRNHFCGDRAQRRHQEPLGDLLVEAVLVDGVVAGDAAAAGTRGTGRAAAPTGRRTALGPRAGTRPASRRTGSRPRGRAPRSPGPGGRLRAARLGRGRPSLRERPALGRRLRRFAAGWLAGLGAVAGRRGRCLPAARGEAARRPTEAWRRCRARTPAGADRDDLGVTHRATPAGCSLAWCSVALEAGRGPGRCGHRSGSATPRSRRTPPPSCTPARSRACSRIRVVSTPRP